MQKLIYKEAELRKLRSSLNGDLVATNGCFDILHIGHIRYLQKAKAHGSYLLVGINSDASVQKLKGPTRPINSESDRAEIISALYFVDFVYIFSEASADHFLQLAQPNIYAKGADYNLDNLPERKTLEEIDCKPVFIQFENGYSTSKIIEELA
jgi:D-glycero-beta-D-manno-heptose 1-phosphate adenylyltransferase